VASLRRREKREARADESRRADLAEAASLGAEFGLGGNAEVARVRVPRTPFWMRQAILWLICCLFVGGGLTIAALAASAWPGNLIGGLLTSAGIVAVWLLGRHARSLVIWHRIYRYPGGIVQMVSGEPEPRVLRWAEVDTVSLAFYDPDDGPIILTWCRLEGSGATIDAGGASGLRYPQAVIRDVARDAERRLAPRIAGSLISSYDVGEPIIAGTWRIDQAGVTSNQHKPGKARLIPWGDVHSIRVSNRRHRRGDVDPPNAITLVPRGKLSLPLSLPLSGVPNGMFLPHLFAHVAERGGVPLEKGSWPGVPAGGETARRRLCR
jgi:hypothetical protein